MMLLRRYDFAEVDRSPIIALNKVKIKVLLSSYIFQNSINFNPNAAILSRFSNIFIISCIFTIKLPTYYLHKRTVITFPGKADEKVVLF